MSKRLYYLVIAIGFAVISIPTLLNIFLEDRISFHFINIGLLKTTFLFIICFNEAGELEKPINKLIGYIAPIFLLFGIMFKFIHWPYGNIYITTSGAVIVTNLFINWLKHSSKDIVALLLLCFIALRIVMILFVYNHFLWWTDLVLCSSITLVSLFKVFKTEKIS